MSRKKEVRLGDAAPDEHVIVFYRGKMTEMICPHQPRSGGTKKRTAKSRARKKRPTKQGIPDEVKTQVEAVVQRCNTSQIRNRRCRYVPRYRGKFLYVDREDYGRLHPICRLAYTGDMQEWSFAIYKYSDERYDDDEWFFPGAGDVDGTIEGAMKAGLKAYPS
jgi:ribosomal protein L32